MLLNSLLADTTKWYPILFDSPLNIAGGIFFWLTLALVIGFLIAVVLLKGDARKKFAKISLLAAIGYACAVGIVLLSMTFAEDGISNTLFYPLLVLLVCVGGSAIALYLKPRKLTAIITGSITGTAGIAVLVCMGVFGDNAKNGITITDNALLYVSAVVLLAVLVVLALIFGRKDKKGFDSKSVSYAAVCIAMSFALSYIRIFQLPQSGSVTVASLLPLMIYSYMFGVKKGVFAGFIYGILQAVQDPWLIHPAQFLLDYPIAFACIGVSGIFANVKKLEKFPQIQFALGAVVASVLRYLSHILSGVFAFADLGADPLGAWTYSLTYNSFVFIDLAIVIAVGVLVFSSKAFVREVRKFNAPAKPATPHTEPPQAVSVSSLEPAPAEEIVPHTEAKPSVSSLEPAPAEDAVPAGSTPVEAPAPAQETPVQETTSQDEPDAPVE